MEQPVLRALLACCVGVGLCTPAWSQGVAAAAPDGTALFQQQCSACHTLESSAPPRQGPTLAGIYGRKAGVVPGYRYSSGFAKADFVWDPPHLDAYLTNPHAVIPGAVMPYRQSKAPVRLAIITFLKDRSK